MTQPSEQIPPPVNPRGAKTLVVDGKDRSCYVRPSDALRDAGPDDQIFIRPGLYEDKIVAARRSVFLVGAGREGVQIFNRRGGPLYLQQVPEGLIQGITFRYVGSDQHSAVNLLDSTCTITGCRMMEGILSGILIYGPESRPIFSENEVCRNRESGIFVFAGARPYVSKNVCHGNHHFGISVRDPQSRPDLVRNTCRDNMLSGMLLFHFAEGMLLENHCHDNMEYGLVITPDCKPSPPLENLAAANRFDDNPAGPLQVTEEPLKEIGR